MNNQDRISVCLVEDDIDIIKAVQSTLESEKQIILAVEHIRKPTQIDNLPSLLVSKGYHVLLVDLGLPSLKYNLDERWKAGLDLLQELDKQQCRSVPIIMTAYPDEGNLIAGARKGAPMLIAKKGEETWPMLPLHIRAAYAYWQAMEERRLRDQEVNMQRTVHFCAELAHDFKGTLAVVQGYDDLIKTQPKGDIQRWIIAFRQGIKDACDIGLFLEATLRGEPRPAKLEVLSWPDIFLQIQRMELMNRHFDLVAKFSFNNSYHGKIMIDAAAIKRAVNNLIYNSLTAMRERGFAKDVGHLEIESFLDGTWLTIKLRDNAGGVTDNIFEHSNGLGLGICKEIVEQMHHGKMPKPIKNKIGGTDFILQFPIKQRERAKRRSSK